MGRGLFTSRNIIYEIFWLKFERLDTYKNKRSGTELDARFRIFATQIYYFPHCISPQLNVSDAESTQVIKRRGSPNKIKQ